MRLSSLAILILLASQTPDVVKTTVLPPSVNNPRNSDGAFLRLKDGILMFVYTRFTGGSKDDSRAGLAAVYSGDQGKTWSLRFEPVVENEGKQNVTTVSLLRMAENEIGLFYLRRDSLESCCPMMRLSTDEGRTWNDAVPCVAGGGYFTMANDRALLLGSGRVILPITRRSGPEGVRAIRGSCLCCYSDNAGRTWRASKTELEGPEVSRTGLQDPAVVELKGGTLMMIARTDMGCQYRSYSRDGGETWSPAEPTNIISPVSPAAIARIPSTGDLMLVWNDHEGVDEQHRGKRTPFCVALSKDDGQTWEKKKTLDDDPDGWYCNTAITFLNESVLLAHCAGDSKVGRNSRIRFTSFELKWLYR